MIRLRPAIAEDAPTVLALIRALATYERAPDAVVATEADLLRDGLGPPDPDRGPGRPLFHVLLAERQESPADRATPIGFAFYFFTYSTWRGRPCLYLEDLFVLPEARRLGAGTLLFRELARIAVRERCDRFVWQVLDWNEPAIRFYEALGANAIREWVTMRLEGEGIARLAMG